MLDLFNYNIVLQAMGGLPQEPATRCDVLKEKSYLESKKIEVIYVREKTNVISAVEYLIDSRQVLGIDIETYGLSAFVVEDKQAGLEPRKSGIRLIQIYDGDQKVYVFDILKLGGVDALGCEIWNKPMIAHNAMFELKHLLHKGACPMKLGCTLLADRILNGNRTDLKDSLGMSKSASLKDVAKELLDIDVSKEMQTSDWSQDALSKEQIDYAALDAVLVVKIFDIQRELIKKKGLVRVYELYRDTQHPVASMEISGIGFDVIKHKELMLSWEIERDVLEKDIVDAIGKELNLNSGKQVSTWLKEALKQEDLEVWATTEKGQLSTSTHTFKLNERMHDIFPKIVEFRHVAKRISSFGETLYKFIDIQKKRLYGSFSLGQTATGRMASSKPNMQNMPRKEFRNLFCARDGYVLIGLDYSQQELRVAALLANDQALLKIYENGEDAHINTAAMVLSLPKEKVVKEHRQLAKALNFGLLYGQGAKGLADYAKRNYGVAMTLEEAEKHRNNFFKIYSGLRNWQRQTGRVTEITGKISTPCGRVRDFSRERNGYRFTATLNHPVQGAAAEITLNALIRLFPILCADCQLVNCIHDEILLEVKEDRAQEFGDLAKDIMKQAFLAVFPKAELYLKGLVDAHIGKNWAETK